MINYYELLGVPFYAASNEIKEAYRKKVKILHPDKGGEEKDFVMLQKAFETLYDEQKRKLYDETYARFFGKKMRITYEQPATVRMYSFSKKTKKGNGLGKVGILTIIVTHMLIAFLNHHKK